MEYQRAHPIQMIQSTAKYFFLLLLPVLRGLLFSGGDLTVWMDGAWFDLLIILVMVTLGYLNWYFRNFAIEPDGIYTHRGIFHITNEWFCYERISTITVEKPFYLALLRARLVKVDTDAGSPRRADLALILRPEESDKLLQYSKNALAPSACISRSYRPRLLYITLLSLISSNIFTGVLFLSTLISQSGNLLGKEFENILVENLTRLVELLTFGIPPAAAIVAYTLLGGWLLAFIVNIIHHKDFTVTRQQQNLTISAGIFVPRTYYINVDRINLVQIQQTIFTKILGFYSVTIHSTGYGKLKNSISVLIPAAGRSEAMQNLELLLPEIPFVKRDTKPHQADFGRFILVPSLLVTVVAAAAVCTYVLLPHFASLALFVSLMLEIPAVAFLVVRIIAYSHTGLGVSHGMLTISFTKHLTFDRVSIPASKISKLEFISNPFQRRTGCCNLMVYTYAERRNRYRVRNLKQAEIAALLAPYMK